jgi:hypothetical protein
MSLTHIIGQHVAHGRRFFTNEGPEIEAELIRDLEAQATRHGRQGISWAEFLVANVLWHDDGLPENLFQSEFTLFQIINQKWPGRFKTMDECLKDLLIA